MKDSSIVLSDCKSVGSGTYGKVYVGTYQGQRYAVKRRYITEDSSVPPGCIHLNEIDVMCRFNHPNILRVIVMQQKSPIPDNFRSDRLSPLGEDFGKRFRADLVYLVSEAADSDLSYVSLSPNGSVKQETYEDTTRVKNELRSIIWQILCGLLHLHDHGIIHRDVKAANVLVFEDSSGDRNIKLCDFDMCMPDNPYLLMSKAMTPEYTPPEVIVQGMDVSYTSKVDVWGVGHIMYHLIKGESILRRGKRTEEELDNFVLNVCRKYLPNGDAIEKFPMWDPKDLLDPGELNVSLDLGDNDVNDLLSHMLDCDPETRWTVKECMSHPFFGNSKIPQTLVEEHFVSRHFITEEMAKVFDSEISGHLSEIEIYGFFLGLDILMRVCETPYKGGAHNLAVCCFNLGMKYYSKESAKFIPISGSNEDVKRIEYNIISRYLKGKIYRPTVYSVIASEHKRIYKYLLAPSVLGSKMPQGMYGYKFSTLVEAVQVALKS